MRALEARHFGYCIRYYNDEGWKNGCANISLHTVGAAQTKEVLVKFGNQKQGR